MTTLDPTKIPPSASSSFERLIAWSGLALHRANPRLSVLEQNGAYAERICQAVIITDTNGLDRLIIRASLELDPQWSADNSQKTWYWAKSVGDTIVAPVFYS